MLFRAKTQTFKGAGTGPSHSLRLPSWKRRIDSKIFFLKRPIGFEATPYEVQAATVPRLSRRMWHKFIRCAIDLEVSHLDCPRASLDVVTSRQA